MNINKVLLIGRVPSTAGEDSIGKYATEISVVKKTLVNYRTTANTFEKSSREDFSRLSFTHFQLCAGQDRGV